MLPNIMPINGMNMASFNLMRRKIPINKKVPAKAKTKATNIRPTEPMVGNNINETNTPNLAESTVAAVDGAINLLPLNRCKIKPAMLILIPAIIMLIKRGMRLDTTTWIFSVWPDKIWERRKSETPINKEKIDNITNIISKYLFFIRSTTTTSVWVSNYANPNEYDSHS